MHRAAFQKIKEDVKNLPKFKDIILRSSWFKDGWSDIDITVIFEEVDFDIMKKLSELYEEWKERFPELKIDIAIVDFEDNPRDNKYFLHRGYQLSYGINKLPKFKTEFRKYPLNEINVVRDIKLMKFSAYMRFVEKLHEIRKTIIHGDFMLSQKLATKQQKIAYNLIKKAKVCAKLFLQIHGYFVEDIEDVLKKLEEKYPEIKNELLRVLEYTDRWREIKHDEKELIKAQKVAYEFTNKLYKYILKEIRDGSLYF